MTVKNKKIQSFTFGGANMLYSYAQGVEIFGTDRKLKLALQHKHIYKIKTGVYSDREYESELAVISMKYPNFIFTLNSAFY